MNIELVHSTIKTIINQFKRKPGNFFNEYDFHQYCFHAFYLQKEFTRQYMTKDGKKTNVLHPEYPTLERFKRKPEGRVDPKGVRARYDIVILNPEFIKNNDFETVRCRDIRKISRGNKAKNIIAALEFKFIIKHRQNYLNEIKFDHLKLANDKEVEHKYMLVFTNAVKNKIEYLKGFTFKESIKAVYIAPKKIGEKKLIIEEYPYRWLYKK